MKKAFYKYWLAFALARKCKAIIHRSGEKGKAENCFSVALDDDSHPFLLLQSIEGDDLVGLKWNGQKYDDPHRLPISSIGKYQLRITHYYGLAEIVYTNIVNFAWHRLTGWVYAKVHYRQKTHQLSQFAFNRKRLLTKKRIELIQFMIEDQIQRTHKGISAISLMSKLYSIKWVLHPDSAYQEEKLELYLESLVASGDLQKINDEYVVQGKAINTLEQYQEEERRHQEAVRIQRRIVVLTIFIALFALVQTGIVSVPTLFDVSEVVDKVWARE